MTIYVLPASDSALRDRFFEDKGGLYHGGVTGMPFWNRFHTAARASGINVHTFDVCKPNAPSPDDILLVQNHPGETLPWRILYFLKHPESRGGFALERQRFFFRHYRSFRRRILIQGESPMVVPFIYRHLNRLRGGAIYHTIFFLSRPPGFNSSNYFNYYDYRDRNIISPYFREPKDKHLVMINANAAPHSFVNELYSERLRAIRHFSSRPGFDLYGYGWDRLPRYLLYAHYRRYVQRVWRGETPEKLKTLGRYRFSLCFENCVYPGYVSEKIYDCLAAGTIPVYLGAPDIATLVPEGCFIDFRNFRNYDELDRHLASITPQRLKQYRTSIEAFLKDDSGRKNLESFVGQVAA